MDKAFLILALIIFGSLGMFILVNQQKNSNPKTIANNLTSILTPTPSQFQIINQNQQNPSNTPPPNPQSQIQDVLKASNSAIIKTTKGDITLQLYNQDAPNTVANFIQKAKTGFYNNLTFHRVEDWVIQGGDPKGNGTGGGVMVTELNNKPFVEGSLGVARGGDIRYSNDAQFFITKTKADWLDQRYTNFGIVTSGMDVVNKMEVGDKILGITIQDN